MTGFVSLWTLAQFKWMVSTLFDMQLVAFPCVILYVSCNFLLFEAKWLTENRDTKDSHNIEDDFLA